MSRPGKQAENGLSEASFIGLQGTDIKFHSFEDFTRMADIHNQLPKEQWWMGLLPIVKLLAQPEPGYEGKVASLKA